MNPVPMKFWSVLLSFVLSGLLRALLRAGVDARLMVFDAMPHAHWYSFDFPESKEALEAQARFLDLHLG